MATFFHGRIVGVHLHNLGTIPGNLGTNVGTGGGEIPGAPPVTTPGARTLVISLSDRSLVVPMVTLSLDRTLKVPA